MSMMQEFKTFAMRGSVVDLAVGVIIGGAFGKIVSSFVSDLIMPPIGVLLGGVDFSNLGLTIKEAVGTTPAVVLKYGVFINTVIDFLIIAFVIFMVIKAMNAVKKQEPAPTAVPTTKTCPECSMTIPIAAKRCGYCTSVVK